MARGKNRQRARAILGKWAGADMSEIYEGDDKSSPGLIAKICQIFAWEHPGKETADVAPIRSTKEKKKWRGGSLEED